MDKQLLFNIFIIVIIALVFLLVLRFNMAKKKKWIDYAQRMKMAFTDGGIIGFHTIEGKFKGCNITIQCKKEASVRSKSYFTHLELFFPAPLRTSFRLSKEGVLQKLGNIMGLEDIKVDDPEFDRRFVIKGQEPHEIRALLNDEVRSALLSLLALGGSVLINQEYLSIIYKGFVSDTQQLHNTLEALKLGADILVKADKSLNG
ncbi:hypothetical protein KKF84_00145 [Myxococcota bacterium]|nr:hypothetical protein [Myxococcota bacterium]MBU1533694.1 hypothetical protein [Myxococcota bacterium]